MKVTALGCCCSRLIPVSEQYDGDKFFTIAADGVKMATPLLLALAVVEISDVVFAVDSIPAVRAPQPHLAMLHSTPMRVP